MHAAASSPSFQCFRSGRHRWFAVLLFLAAAGLLIHPLVHTAAHEECTLCTLGQGASPLPASMPEPVQHTEYRITLPALPTAQPVPRLPYWHYPTGLSPPFPDSHPR